MFLVLRKYKVGKGMIAYEVYEIAGTAKEARRLINKWRTKRPKFEFVIRFRRK